jgi:hypothetical protein
MTRTGPRMNEFPRKRCVRTITVVVEGMRSLRREPATQKNVLRGDDAGCRGRTHISHSACEDLR